MTRSDELIRLADGTRTIREIANMMTLSDNAVRSLAYYVRSQRGVPVEFLHCGRGPKPAPVVPRKPKRGPMTAAAQRIKRGDIHIGCGSILHLIDSLSPEIGLWLVDQVIEGTSVSDILRAIIVDAYHDELEAREAAQ